MPASNPNTITSANSVYTLVIPGLYSAGVNLQGYMADAAFETDAADVAELVRGVDGVLSGGFVFFNTNQTISIMPDSPSSVVFENWLAAEKAQQEKIVASGSISIPSVGRKYALSQGYLFRIVQVPAARRVLQGRPFVISWGDVSPANQ